MARDNFKRYNPQSESTPTGTIIALGSPIVTSHRSESSFTELPNPNIKYKSTSEEQETENGKIEDQSSIPGFIGRFLSGNQKIDPKNLIILVFAVYIIFVCWLFLQDNNLSKIDTFVGIKVFGLKLFWVTCLFLLIIIIIGICALFRKWMKNNR